MELNVEELVQKQIVADVLAKIPKHQRDELLEKSMTKALESVFSTWNVEQAVRKDAEIYMAEYIKQPEVQEKIRNAVHESFDNVLKGMVAVFEDKIEDTMKNNYVSFKNRPVK